MVNRVSPRNPQLCEQSLSKILSSKKWFVWCKRLFSTKSVRRASLNLSSRNVGHTMDYLTNKTLPEKLQLVAGGCAAAWFSGYLFHALKHKYNQSIGDTPLPPGPFPLPLIGSLHKVVANFGPDGNPRIHIGLGDMAKTYGGIYGLWMGCEEDIIWIRGRWIPSDPCHPGQ
jgi:hypothetical protein